MVGVVVWGWGGGRGFEPRTSNFRDLDQLIQGYISLRENKYIISYHKILKELGIIKVTANTPKCLIPFMSFSNMQQLRRKLSNNFVILYFCSSIWILQKTKMYGTKFPQMQHSLSF